ncbi:hypothetical protein BC629DRAFT_1434224 [Irpex lacteus]|nr:hypothetical protein BC629DRAFT_1434224 [Irpex lacteus]
MTLSPHRPARTSFTRESYVTIYNCPVLQLRVVLAVLDSGMDDELNDIQSTTREKCLPFLLADPKIQGSNSRQQLTCTSVNPIGYCPVQVLPAISPEPPGRMGTQRPTPGARGDQKLQKAHRRRKGTGFGPPSAFLQFAPAVVSGVLDFVPL